MSDERTGPAGAAKVDYVVDERGAKIDLPPDSTLAQTDRAEAAIGATGPTNWWRIGIIAIAVLAVALFVMQILGGNPGTEVIPDTPVAAPETGETPPPASPAP
ncbi:hypothetical protein EMQ25_00715 [Arsenicitalea aurantiaca]|uniref:Uncharacterized protein n=1 Tax=Arsenicitalea aurantiaca TaxID=1783274 RepID=A0A433XKB9_9HYPH|nr:hypothetical protein [Arsenicitalea aurantiaca]RUT34520.1 hypothetical protein EMQ25_00715 [Arsenicitalea aurantiaca]